MPDYEKILLAVAPHGKAAIRAGFAASMQQCIDYADLTTKARLADFIAQCAHESDGFNAIVEYASGAAYNGRKDLGNIHPGDGPKYKGRGEIEVTGEINYEACGKALGIDCVAHPELLATWPYAALSAAWFWKTHGLNKFADANDFSGETHRINGGLNGLASRQAYRAKAQHALGDVKGALLASAAAETHQATSKAGLAGAPTMTAALSLAALHPAVAAPASAVALGSILSVSWLTSLVLSIRRHNAAAVALTAAAQGV